MKALLIFSACFVVTACQGPTIYTVSQVFKEADTGLRGKVEVVGIYDFHSEEDALRDCHDGPMLQLVLLPLLKDIPIRERYEARKQLGERFRGRRVLVSGELKKGRLAGWSRDVFYVSVSKLEKMANQSPEPTR